MLKLQPGCNLDYISSHVITIRLPEELGTRLKELADRTHRTKAFYAREAIEQHLADIEDAYLAAELSRRVATGEMPTGNWEDLRQEFNVKDEKPDITRCNCKL